MINGKEPYVGAKVYDIQLGAGTITQIEPDQSFIVSMAGGRNMRYSRGGYIGTARRIYWKNPIIIEPFDGDNHIWGTFVTMVKSIFDLLDKLRDKNG